MKILIVGFGASGQRFAETLRGMNIPDLELWVHSRSMDIKLIQTDLQSYKPGDPFKHYNCNFLEDMSNVSNLGFKFAIIATTPNSHFEIARNLLTNGIPCMIEKPLALTQDESAVLLALAAKADLALHVCYQSKFHPMLDVLKTYSTTNYIGTQHFAIFNYCELISSMQPFRKELTNHELNQGLSGGVAFSLSHELYFLTQVLDSQLDFSGISKKGIENNTNDAILQINATFKGEISGNSFPCFLNLDLLTWPPNRKGAIHGNKGSLSWDWIEQTVTLESIEAGIEFWDFSKTSRKEIQALQLKYFIDIVHTTNYDNTDSEKWLKVVEIATILSSLPKI